MELLLVLGVLWLFGEAAEKTGEAVGELEGTTVLLQGDTELPMNRWVLVEGTKNMDRITWEYVGDPGRNYNLETDRVEDGWRVRASGPPFSNFVRMEFTGPGGVYGRNAIVTP